MSKINLKNMPHSELYEFAPNRYVWKILRAGGTRGGIYLSSLDNVSEYTEVFYIRNGDLYCEWSGRLGTNPRNTDENGLDSEGCFYIFSADQDCGASFKQEQELLKADSELQVKALEKEEQVVSYIKSMLEAKKGRRA